MKVNHNLILLATLLSATACMAFAASKTALSDQTKGLINDKLAKSSSDDVLQFDRNGLLLNTFNIGRNKLLQYRGLPDFLNSLDSPVSSCKHPVPTPPPGCVMCDDGHPLCSKVMK